MFRIKCLDMSPKYRKREEKQVEVEVEISLVSISSINLARMELSLDLHLVQFWTDSRCRFKMFPGQERLVTLQGYGLQDRLEHLWIPDTYIINAVTTKSHPAPQPQQTTKVSTTDWGLRGDAEGKGRNCNVSHIYGILGFCNFVSRLISAEVSLTRSD